MDLISGNPCSLSRPNASAFHGFYLLSLSSRPLYFITSSYFMADDIAKVVSGFLSVNRNTFSSYRIFAQPLPQIIFAMVKIPVILAGLSAGLSLSHVLEIPGKHGLTALESVHVHHTFYGGYAIFASAAWIYCSAAGGKQTYAVIYLDL